MWGYGFLARTLLEQKRLLMQGFSFDVCHKLFYTANVPFKLVVGPHVCEPTNRLVKK
jgi:hypothetical protein